MKNQLEAYTTDDGLPPDALVPHVNYFTTSSIANLCGVSRLTVRNWVESGKIKAIRTIGGHRRVARSEVLNLFRMLNSKNQKKIDHAFPHCWQYAEKTHCRKECTKCLAYLQKVDYCFLIVQRFGKRQLHCEGNCPDCGYFKDISEQIKMVRNLNPKNISVSYDDISKEKKEFLKGISYGVGRGMQEIRKKLDGIRHEVSDAGPGEKKTRKAVNKSETIGVSR
jgi:excisionase family DNA binding protein